MNLLLLQPSQLLDNQLAELSPRQVAHLANVLKAKHRQTLKVGIIGGQIGGGTLDTSTDPWRIHLEKLTTPAPPRLPVTLVLALPRPQMIKRIMQTAASMGATSIYLIQTERVEKNYWQSPTVTRENLLSYFILGAEQAVDTHLPNVCKVQQFDAFIEQHLPQLCTAKTRLFAHPLADSPMPNLPGNQGSLVAIGPEGGFTHKEITVFENCGFQGFHLGKRILKVETAVPVVLTGLYPPQQMHR